jgi:hypothetical protein
MVDRSLLADGAVDLVALVLRDANAIDEPLDRGGEPPAGVTGRSVGGIGGDVDLSRTTWQLPPPPPRRGTQELRPHPGSDAGVNGDLVRQM